MHPQGAKFTGVTDQAVADGLDKGTVIADEHHQQAIGSQAIPERPVAPIDTGQVEIGSRGVKFTNRCLGTNHCHPLCSQVGIL